MPRFRAARSDTRSSLTAPFLRRIALIPEKVEAGRFPFTLPIFKRGSFAHEITTRVTFLVGENGTGKSTLIEAIARNSGFNTRGGSRDNRYGDADDDGGLAAALRLSWLPKVDGFFFRAESFFNFVSYVEEAYREDYNRVPPWGERSLHHRSHGEAFLGFFEARLGSHRRCLYLLDEPEAALSPERQLEFMAMLDAQRATGNVQYIIATHSPLLMAYPGAEILLFDERGMRRASLAETPHFRRYDEFFRDPDRFLATELARLAEERRAPRDEAKDE